MILFEAEDAIGVSRLNREIMDFLAIAEPAVTMEIKEAANRGEFGFCGQARKIKRLLIFFFLIKWVLKLTINLRQLCTIR